MDEEKKGAEQPEPQKPPRSRALWTGAIALAVVAAVVAVWVFLGRAAALQLLALLASLAIEIVAVKTVNGLALNFRLVGAALAGELVAEAVWGMFSAATFFSAFLPGQLGRMVVFAAMKALLFTLLLRRKVDNPPKLALSALCAGAVTAWLPALIGLVAQPLPPLEELSGHPQQ